jgi:hypothetical protein
MIDFIKKLPLDIILQIIPYTYNLQNKKLLCDIINYKQVKTILLESYNDFWRIEIESEDTEEYKDWLINDLFVYANNYNPLMYGYNDKFYDIFTRNIFLKTRMDVYKYVHRLEKREVSSQINILLALLNPNERNEMLVNARESYYTFYYYTF